MNRADRPMGKTSKDDTKEEIRIVRACVPLFELFLYVRPIPPRKSNEPVTFPEKNDGFKEDRSSRVSVFAR